MTSKDKISKPGLDGDPDLFKVLTEINMISELAKKQFESILPDGMTEAQFGVLNRIVRLGISETVGELATAFQVAQPTMSSTLRRLEDKGCVKLTVCEGNRRAKTVSITDKGRQAREDAIAALAPYFATFQSAVPGMSWKNELKKLAKLRAYLEQQRAEKIKNF